MKEERNKGRIRKLKARSTSIQKEKKKLQKENRNT
jgi:hypothetical protein